MELHVLGSSSDGNCYLLKTETAVLILECGVNIYEIKKALAFNFSNVVGCVVSHEHGDHIRGAAGLATMGVNIYASKGTINAAGYKNHHRFYSIEEYLVKQLGPFRVMPFKVNHDCAEPFGFIINHPDSGNILFITDTTHVKNKFKNIHQIMIEANFSEEIIRRNNLQHFRTDRIYKSHMSLETCADVLKANDLSLVRNIVLIHLSDSNSHAKEFQRIITGCTGKNVHIADAGDIISLQKNPF
jgi:phosphoribosyl 1,2-cyclic phosphodiesterase